jgi:hypothetical protein
MELPRVAAVKVKKMLAMVDRVNPKSLLDHEFSGQSEIWSTSRICDRGAMVRCEKATV